MRRKIESASDHGGTRDRYVLETSRRSSMRHALASRAQFYDELSKVVARGLLEANE